MFQRRPAPAAGVFGATREPQSPPATPEQRRYPAAAAAAASQPGTQERSRVSVSSIERDPSVGGGGYTPFVPGGEAKALDFLHTQPRVVISQGQQQQLRGGALHFARASQGALPRRGESAGTLGASDATAAPPALMRTTSTPLPEVERSDLSAGGAGIHGHRPPPPNAPPAPPAYHDPLTGLAAQLRCGPIAADAHFADPNDRRAVAAAIRDEVWRRRVGDSQLPIDEKRAAALETARRMRNERRRLREERDAAQARRRLLADPVSARLPDDIAYEYGAVHYSGDGTGSEGDPAAASGLPPHSSVAAATRPPRLTPQAIDDYFALPAYTRELRLERPMPARGSARAPSPGARGAALGQQKQQQQQRRPPGTAVYTDLVALVLSRRAAEQQAAGQAHGRGLSIAALAAKAAAGGASATPRPIFTVAANGSLAPETVPGNSDLRTMTTGDVAFRRAQQRVQSSLIAASPQPTLRSASGRAT